MLPLVILAVPFVSIMATDPVTMEKQAAFATVENGNTIMLRCRPARAEMYVMVSPDGFHGSSSRNPKADSRFGKQPAPELNSWYFQDENLFYGPTIISPIEKMARFLDHLARDDEFNLRYQVSDHETRNMTIRYTLDQAELRSFIGKCGPKKVIAKLREMGSPVAPAL